jgi:polyisoprenoid-binding protein YceI
MKTTLFAFVLAAAASMTANTWRVEQGQVRVTCPLTIGGSFETKTTALSGVLSAGLKDSRRLDGFLTVDLRTLDTGISLRNTHLRENYLEVGKGAGFETATLAAIELKGLDPDLPEGKGTFTGMLTLHGATRPVTGIVDAHRAGAGLRVKASFPVSLTEYGISKPRYLGVGVEDSVQVEVGFPAIRGETR